MNSNTYVPDTRNINREWSFIDANDRVLGDVASEIATKLIGKHRPDYVPNANMGDKVVVTNADKVAVTGKKMRNKVYYRHTGYPGGIRSETLGHLFQRDARQVIRRAVKGMLPRNKLLKQRMANLYIYEGAEHPHKAQETK